MIGWALRWVSLCCGLALVCGVILDHRAAFFSDRAPPGETARTVSAVQATGPIVNTLVYPANEHGHVILEAAVNGVPIRLLVDTGASLVSLTPRDARAVGVSPGELMFTLRVNTANGSARMAPVTLREIRIGQLALYDVPAAVLENLNISLLGMSFLGRLQSYEMREGKLSINW
jgi:aspartyl protease family protein